VARTISAHLRHDKGRTAGRTVGTARHVLLVGVTLALALGAVSNRVHGNSRGPQERARAQAASRQQASTMKINIRIEGKVLTGTLSNSRAAQDFASLLPLSLTLEDYASTEKISNLPKRLSSDDAPPGFDPSVGDIAYYAPWGNLAIFYKDFGYSRGLVSLGKLDEGTDVLARSGKLQVTFELVQQK
jgi:hypothetical protein